METKPDDSCSPLFNELGNVKEPGLSKREHFASMAMQAILQATPLPRLNANNAMNAIAYLAVAQADILIQALNDDDEVVKTIVSASSGTK